MIESFRSRLRAWLQDASIQRLIKNASFLFSAQMLVTLISVVQFPIVSRWLGPENYGLWGLASSWVGLVGQIFTIRLWETVVKYLSQFMAENDEARALAVIKLSFLIDVTASSLIFLLIVGSAGLAAPFVYKSYANGVNLIQLETISGMMTFTMSIWMAVLRVFDRFKHISLYNVVSSIAQFVLWMLVIRFNGGLVGLILTAALVKLGQTITLAILAQRELGRHFKRHWLTADLGVLRNHRRAIGILLFSMNFDTYRKAVNNNADILLLGFFATPVQVGIFKLGKQLASYVNTLFGPFYDALYPEIPRLYASEGPGPLRVFIRRVTFGLGLGMLAIVAAAWVLGPVVIPVIWPQYTSAITVFLILMLNNFWVVLFWVPSLMVMLGKSPQMVTINFIISSVTLLALAVFTALWQAPGAALASAVNFAVGLVIYLWYLNRMPEFKWRRIFLNV